MPYEFLVLSCLFLLPGLLVWCVRPDLRGLMKRTVPLSLPFAATEWLFYPAYWSPRFLFDLADHLGFGLEDVLFVAGLGAFCSTAYAVVFRRTVVPRGRTARPWARALGATGLLLALAGLLVARGVPILYASVGAMVLGTSVVLGIRRDLILPSLGGALASMVIYLGLSLLFELLVPGVYTRTWRPSLLLHGHVLGVPLDELLYGLGSGLLATAFPTWALGLRFAPPPPRRALRPPAPRARPADPRG